MDECRFLDIVDFSCAKLDSWLSLEGSFFKKDVKLEAATLSEGANLMVSVKGKMTIFDSVIVGNLYMNYGEFMGGLNMAHTKIQGELDMTDSPFSKEVNMNSIQVTKYLTMARSKFKGRRFKGPSKSADTSSSDEIRYKSVDLSAAKVGGQVNMIGCEFADYLDMHSIDIGRNLFMREKGNFHEIELTFSKIGGTLDMMGSLFNKKVDMSSIQVTKDVRMDLSKFLGRDPAEPSQNLDTSGSDEFRYRSVNLSSAQVGGEIHMIGCKFADSLDMHAVDIGQNLFMGQKGDFQNVDLTFSKIGGNSI